MPCYLMSDSLNFNLIAVHFMALAEKMLACEMQADRGSALSLHCSLCKAVCLQLVLSPSLECSLLKPNFHSCM